MHSYQRYVKQPEKKNLVFIAAVVIGNKRRWNRKPRKAQEQLYLWGKTGILKDFLKSPRWCILGLGTDCNLKCKCKNNLAENKC